MWWSEILHHAADTQKGALDVDHFSFAQYGQRAFTKAVAIQRTGLINDHLAIHQQTSACSNRYAPNFIFGIDLRANRQNDDHGRAARAQFICLQHKHGAYLADFAPATGVQVRYPHLAAPHHFHHCSGSGSPGLRPSALSKASLSSGRNSSAILRASRRTALSE